MDKESTKVPVYIEKVIFSNESSNFAILACKLNPSSVHYRANSLPSSWVTSQFVTIKSYHFNEVASCFGHPHVFIGKVVQDARWGPQFLSRWQFTDEIKEAAGLEHYLRSLPFIDKVRSRKIVEKLGIENVVDVLENRPEELLSIKVGLPKKSLELIKEEIIHGKWMRDLYIWMGKYDISYNLASKIIDKWEDDAVAILEENPYCLTELRGVGFQKADGIALRIFGENVDHHNRAISCLTYLLRDKFYNMGSLCYPRRKLTAAAGQLLVNEAFPLEVARKIYRSIFEELFTSDESPFVIHMKGDQSFVYMRDIRDKEQHTASFFVKLKEESVDGSSSFVERFEEESIKEAECELCEFQQKDEFLLNETQRDAVRSAFTKKITIITGGGGTGKSTICRAICNISKSLHLHVIQMAPTGRAAKVLKDKTSSMAATIHRALGLLPGQDVPRNMITQDIVIIDEVSMCGLDTLFPLSLALPAAPRGYNFNLVLVGDPQQLPSVSPGNFLSDIMASDLTHIVKLDRIYRQDEHSYIPVIANQIAKGEIPEIPEDATDITWHEIKTDKQVLSEIRTAVDGLLDSGIDVFDFQIICPMYRGIIGIDNINIEVQELVSKRVVSEPPSIKVFMRKFYVDDKIMQQENNYDKDVFNGEVGRIIEVGNKLYRNPDVPDDRTGMFVTVHYGGQGAEQKIVTYWNDEIEQVRLAWCCSVHKYQGSQCPRIFFIMSGSHSIMMNRQLVYTAITRAEQEITIWGSTAMLQLAAGKCDTSIRYTGFQDHVARMKKQQEKTDNLDESTIFDFDLAGAENKNT